MEVKYTLKLRQKCLGLKLRDLNLAVRLHFERICEYPINVD